MVNYRWVRALASGWVPTVFGFAGGNTRMTAISVSAGDSPSLVDLYGLGRQGGVGFGDSNRLRVVAARCYV